MGRPRGEPSTVLRLPKNLVGRIDDLRGDRSRAAYLDALVPQRDEYDGSPPVAEARRAVEHRGSPSPSLKRFGS